jgi:hypothetical protein
MRLLLAEYGDLNTYCLTEMLHIISYIISYHIVSYRIMSCHVMSCHVTSHHITSQHISYIISYHIISYHIICFHSVDPCRIIRTDEFVVLRNPMYLAVIVVQSSWIKLWICLCRISPTQTLFDSVSVPAGQLLIPDILILKLTLNFQFRDRTF